MKTKLLAFLILLAGVLHCPAPIPYIVNSNGSGTNLTINSTYVTSTNYTAINWPDPNANGNYLYAGTNMNAAFTAAYAPLIFEFWTNTAPSSENWQLVVDPFNGALGNGNQVIQFATSNALAFTRTNFRGNTNYGTTTAFGSANLNYFTTWGQSLNPSPPGIIYPGSNTYPSLTVAANHIVTNVNVIGNLSVAGSVIEQSLVSTPINPMLTFSFMDPAGNTMKLLTLSDETRSDVTQSLEKAMRIDLYGNNVINTNFNIGGPTINPPSAGRFCFNALSNNVAIGSDSRVAIFESWASDITGKNGGSYQIQVYPNPNGNLNSIYGYSNGAVTLGPKLSGDPQYPLPTPIAMVEVYGGYNGVGLEVQSNVTVGGYVSSQGQTATNVYFSAVTGWTNGTGTNYLIYCAYTTLSVTNKNPSGTPMLTNASLTTTAEPYFLRPGESIQASGSITTIAGKPY